MTWNQKKIGQDYVGCIVKIKNTTYSGLYKLDSID